MSQQYIGRYRILERVAAGGQATVYRAWDGTTGQVVALKVLHPHLAHDASYIERFHREARLTVSIDHPNIVRIFEVEKDEDSHFISMEYLPESLHHVLESGGRFTVEQAVGMVHQVSLGLQAAYEAGVEVHGDIKPQNILVASDGTLKVTDFGIARAADQSGLTRTGAVMGTPHFMSPEQAQGERVDIRADIYGLGVVLYQLLTGELPFNADTPMAILRMHREEIPRPIRQIVKDVPPVIESIVRRCLEKNPARRYQSPIELAQALQSVTSGEAHAVQAVENPNQSATSPQATRRYQTPIELAKVIQSLTSQETYAVQPVEKQSPSAASIQARLSPSPSSLSKAIPPLSGMGPVAKSKAGSTWLRLTAIAAIVVVVLSLAVTAVGRSTPDGAIDVFSPRKLVAKAELAQVQTAMNILITEQGELELADIATNVWTELPMNEWSAPLSLYLGQDKTEYYYCWDEMGTVTAQHEAPAACQRSEDDSLLGTNLLSFGQLAAPPAYPAQ